MKRGEYKVRLTVGIMPIPRQAQKEVVLPFVPQVGMEIFVTEGVVLSVKGVLWNLEQQDFLLACTAWRGNPEAKLRELGWEIV